MTSDELRSEEPERSERSWIRTILLMAVPLALVWAAAFWITGLMWWEAGTQVEPVPPPETAEIQPVDSDSIDLDRYTKAHPSWTP